MIYNKSYSSKKVECFLCLLEMFSYSDDLHFISKCVGVCKSIGEKFKIPSRSLISGLDTPIIYEQS